MKKILFTLVLIGLSGLIFSGQVMAEKLEQRQVWQKKGFGRALNTASLPVLKPAICGTSNKKSNGLRNFFGATGA